MKHKAHLNKDSAFYWSICILRRLRDMGLISKKEYENIHSISSKHYGVNMYLCLKR